MKYTKFYLPTMFHLARSGPLTLNTGMCSEKVMKSVKHDNIDNLCLLE